MDPAFYSFFRDSLEEAQRRDRFRAQELPRPWLPAHYIASGGLEAARGQAGEQGRRVRPDAELLIYLMSREFVAKPGIAVREIPEPELESIVADDMRTLVAEAEDGEEVSGHALLVAAGSRWDSLRSSALNFWGP
ncbi:MAG: hypothetical protein QOF06_175 [Solirubrobacterales bacterium]|jgi:hypothetical protein|nr:hypothetical protein [Solirubrobacterales bacterium]